jgi:hypothetical protein
MQTVRSGGHDYQVPKGGWVTHAQQQNPNLRTTVIDNHNTTIVNNKIVDVHNYYGGCWGGGWWNNPCGFYAGSNFWFGFAMGEAIGGAPWWGYGPYWERPVYVVSPVTGEPCGQVQPPQGGYQDPNQAYANVLQIMAQPNDQDPMAGLYLQPKHWWNRFHPDNPGQKLSAEQAFNELKEVGHWGHHGIFFRAPNGGFEKINNFDDLRVYLYTQEQQQDAPSQQGGDNAPPTPAPAPAQLSPAPAPPEPLPQQPVQP